MYSIMIMYDLLNKCIIINDWKGFTTIIKHNTVNLQHCSCVCSNSVPIILVHTYVHK